MSQARETESPRGSSATGLAEATQRGTSASTVSQVREMEPPQQHAGTSSIGEVDLLGPLESEPAPFESVEVKGKGKNLPSHQIKHGVESPEGGSGSPSQNRVVFRGHGKRSGPKHEKGDRTPLLDPKSYGSGRSSSVSDAETEKPALGGVELLRRELVTDQDAESQGTRPDFPQAESHSYPLTSSNLGRPPDYEHTGELSILVSGDDRIPVPPPRVGSRYIFLCMPTFTSKEQLECATISSCATDQQMYLELHKKYYTWWRTVQRWITMRRLNRIDFVRVRPMPDESNYFSHILC